MARNTKVKKLMRIVSGVSKQRLGDALPKLNKLPKVGDVGKTPLGSHILGPVLHGERAVAKADGLESHPAIKRSSPKLPMVKDFTGDVTEKKVPMGHVENKIVEKEPQNRIGELAKKSPIKSEEAVKVTSISAPLLTEELLERRRNKEDRKAELQDTSIGEVNGVGWPAKLRINVMVELDNFNTMPTVYTPTIKKAAAMATQNRKKKKGKKPAHRMPGGGQLKY